MNQLKLVALTMSVLGLVSCPVSAATQSKHKHHKKLHRSHVVEHDYKAMGSLPVQPAPVTVVDVPSVDGFQSIKDAMNQSSDHSRPMPDWFNRVTVSGGASVDAHWGQRANPLYTGLNTKRISINDAYLDINANVNDWTKAFMDVSYSTTSRRQTSVASNGPAAVVTPLRNYSFAYSNPTTLTFEQAYVTLGNSDVSPFFVQVGKQFQDFGRYKTHSLTRSATQVLSESNQVSARVSFIDKSGLHGSVFAFENPSVKVGKSHANNVYGASIGFDQPNDQLGYAVGLGYLTSMTGVSDVNAFLKTSKQYNRQVGAMSLYGDVNSGPFSFSGRYATALQSFKAADMPRYVANNSNVGSAPHALDLTANYGFNVDGKNQNVYLGYQATAEAARLVLPKSRWLAGYNVDVMKNTNVAVEVTRDKDYNLVNGGTNKTTGTVAARATVLFG